VASPLYGRATARSRLSLEGHPGRAPTGSRRSPTPSTGDRINATRGNVYGVPVTEQYLTVIPFGGGRAKMSNRIQPSHRRPSMYRADALVPVLAFIIAGCESGDEPDSSHHQCPGRQWKVEVFLPDSLGGLQACNLVEIALRAIAATTGDTGLSTADTAHVSSVLVAPMGIVDERGVASDYWGIEFRMDHEQYNAQVEIDRSTGAVTAHRTHSSSF
jgi:hypothetical protein